MISILLVDNQPSFIEMAGKLLVNPGDNRLTIARSGKKALELLTKSDFDIIISDHRPPRVDGIGLLKTLRARGDQTPVIIYAGRASADIAIEAMRNGADLFLQKSEEPGPQLDELKCVIAEIVKRRRIEDRLYRRERDFRTIVEKNADAMIVIDRSGIIRYVNPAATGLFKMSASDMCGKLLGAPIVKQQPVDMDIVRSFAEVAAAEMRVVEVEWDNKPCFLITFRDVSRHVKLEEELLKARDEMEIRVEERTCELKSINEKLKKEIDDRLAVEEELKVEIEERSTAEEELRVELDNREKIEEALADAKERAEMYLDLMGHDINNMNQIGIGYLELACESDDLETMRSLIAKPLEVMKNTSRIIDNVRKIKTITVEGVKKDAALTVVNLCSLLQELKETYSHIPGRTVMITVTTPPLCFVKANDLIADVFANLIDNSVKHSSPDVALNISIDLKRVREKGAEFYLCSVEDNGPGIPDWVKSKLFTRFQRGDTKAHGRGLGLYLVKMLVESYGGAIWVEDRVSGDYKKGAKFVVMLPAAE